MSKKGSLFQRYLVGVDAALGVSEERAKAASRRIIFWVYGRNAAEAAFEALDDETRHTDQEPEHDQAPGPERPLEPEAVPRAGEVLIRFFCRGDFREAILGDLAEKFADRVEENGAFSARWWYWRQVARSTAAFTWRWIRRLAEIDEVLERIGF